MNLDRKLVGLLRRMKVVPEKVRQRRSSGPGAHLSKGLGQSMDFSEYRPYQPGDDLRAEVRRRVGHRVALGNDAVRRGRDVVDALRS